MNDLNHLVQRLHEGNASVEEIEKLKKIVRAGDSDAALRAVIDKVLMEQIEATHIHHTTSSHASQTHGNALYTTMFNTLKVDTAQTTPSLPPGGRGQDIQWGLAAAAVLVVAIVAGVYVAVDYRMQHTNTVATPIASPHTFNGKQHVVLPDGSTVIMNEGSKLTYHDNYGEDTREVQLSGEAYFKVKPDKAHSFIVKAGKLVTRVLGTEFNVNAYTQNKDIVVTVAHGSVEVYQENKALDVVTRQQQITVAKGTDQFSKAAVDATASLGWMDDFLILDDITLETAMDMIATKYKVKIVVAEAAKKCKVTATFLEHKSLAHVLMVVNAIHQTQYTIHDDGSVEVAGGACD